MVWILNYVVLLIFQTRRINFLFLICLYVLWIQSGGTLQTKLDGQQEPRHLLVADSIPHTSIFRHCWIWESQTSHWRRSPNHDRPVPILVPRQRRLCYGLINSAAAPFVSNSSNLCNVRSRHFNDSAHSWMQFISNKVDKFLYIFFI